MLKLTLRIAITVINLGLLAALWWVSHSTPPAVSEVASINVENVTPEEVATIMAITGGDEDGGILNEDNQ